MARKRSTRTPAGSSSPNTVLVVFLVLFILATLGLGGWVYSIFGERAKWEKQAKDAEVKVAAAKKAEDWALLQEFELRNMMGDPSMQDDKSTEFEQWKLLHAELISEADGKAKLNDAGKFKDEKDKDAFFKLVENARTDLGWNPATHRYKTTYRDRMNAVKNEATTARAAGFRALEKQLAAEKKERSLAGKFEKSRAEQNALIEKGNAAALAEAAKQSDLMTQEIKKNTEQRAELVKLDTAYRKQITQLKAKIEEQAEELRRAGIGAVAQKDGKKGAQRPTAVAAAHALLLDISKGKPLWDRPRGKIVRIDEKARQVYIDKGARDGIKRGLTFNVFGAGWEGRAEGPFKGTIEVIRVESGTAAARITSLYDSHGNEVSLNDPSPSKILRGGSNPWKEGDLIFNLVWGAHIAVAGVVDFNGRGAEAAAAQQDELQEFLSAAESQGVTVDAYVDLRDGKIRGEMTPRTAYLVVGHKAFVDKGGDANRAKAVNESVAALQKRALERGLFQISPENFLNVVGYRRPRSKTDAELSHFHPGMPFAGVALTGAAAAEGTDSAAAELTGRWAGKLAGGGQLRLNFKGDGGCVWQLVVGTDTLNGYTNVVQAGKEFRAVIQNRPVTIRFVGGAGTLQVTGPNTEATLTRQ
jgi:hypothetical protein